MRFFLVGAVMAILSKAGTVECSELGYVMTQDT
jgi:hypothetical protein